MDFIHSILSSFSFPGTPYRRVPSQKMPCVYVCTCVYVCMYTKYFYYLFTLHYKLSVLYCFVLHGALHCSVICVTVRRLLRMGVSPDACNDDGLTALHQVSLSSSLHFLL